MDDNRDNGGNEKENMKENGEFQSLRRIKKAQKKKYDKLLKEAHTKYLSDLISDKSNDPKSLFKLIDSIVSNSKENILPGHESGIELAERFNEHFMEKVFVIQKNLEGLRATSNSYTEEIGKYQVALIHFRETSGKLRYVARLIQKKSNSLDPIPTWLLNICKATFTSPELSTLL